RQAPKLENMVNLIWDPKNYTPPLFSVPAEKKALIITNINQSGAGDFLLREKTTDGKFTLRWMSGSLYISSVGIPIASGSQLLAIDNAGGSAPVIITGYLIDP